MRFLFALFWMLTVPAAGQTTLFGRVTDLDTGEALVEAYLVLVRADSSSTLQAWTNETGWFVFPQVPAGSWHLSALFDTAEERFRLQSHQFKTERPLITLNVQLPTTFEPSLSTQNILQSGFKSLSLITGINQEAQLTDAQGYVIPGSQTDISPHTHGVLQGTLRRGSQPASEAQIELDGFLLAITDIEGRFRVEDLKTGKHTLQLIHQQDTLSIPDLPINLGPNTVHFDLQPGR